MIDVRMKQGQMTQQMSKRKRRVTHRWRWRSHLWPRCGVSRGDRGPGPTRGPPHAASWCWGAVPLNGLRLEWERKSEWVSEGEEWLKGRGLKREQGEKGNGMKWRSIAGDMLMSCWRWDDSKEGFRATSMNIKFFHSFRCTFIFSTTAISVQRRSKFIYRQQVWTFSCRLHCLPWFQV